MRCASLAVFYGCSSLSDISGLTEWDLSSGTIFDSSACLHLCQCPVRLPFGPCVSIHGCPLAVFTYTPFAACSGDSTGWLTCPDLAGFSDQEESDSGSWAAITTGRRLQNTAGLGIVVHGGAPRAPLGNALSSTSAHAHRRQLAAKLDFPEETGATGSYLQVESLWKARLNDGTTCTWLSDQFAKERAASGDKSSSMCTVPPSSVSNIMGLIQCSDKEAERCVSQCSECVACMFDVSETHTPTGGKQTFPCKIHRVYMRRTLKEGCGNNCDSLQCPAGAELHWRQSAVLHRVPAVWGLHNPMHPLPVRTSCIQPATSCIVCSLQWFLIVLFRHQELLRLRRSQAQRGQR